MTLEEHVLQHWQLCLYFIGHHGSTGHVGVAVLDSPAIVTLLRVDGAVGVERIGQRITLAIGIRLFASFGLNVFRGVFCRQIGRVEAVGYALFAGVGDVILGQLAQIAKNCVGAAQTQARFVLRFFLCKG